MTTGIDPGCPALQKRHPSRPRLPDGHYGAPALLLAALVVASNAPGPGNALLPSPKGLDVAAPEVQVLLSSIEMTVSLIDAYGRCRDDEKTHERCMRIIRNTLEHARSMIGH